MNSSINVTVERLGTWPTVPVCQMALAFVGLWLNIVSFAALILMHTSTKNTFYLMIISLSIVDMLYLTETLFYSLPCALARRIFLGAIFDRVVGHVDTITWFGQCSHVCFIAFNRFRFTCNTSLEKFDDVFSKTKTLMWLLGLWLFSL
uniref:G-protein coupled receptors family 1 profile domain-containing protein n=1 Tax=Romanomermis culicivorax TaxID=13658 RepID=A0A915IS28_ROMCU